VIENSYKHSVAGRLIFVFILQALYNTLTIGSWGRTVGMRAVGTLVVDANTGNRFGMGRAFGRYCAEAVLGLPTLLFFGFLLLPVLDLLWPLWDARNQTLHDKIASTVVIRG